jgi:WD40 repeat protein
MFSAKKDLIKMERRLEGGHEVDDSRSVRCVTSTETYVITGGDDSKAVVWERGGAGKIVRTLEGHTNWVLCLDTTPCEKYVVTG